MAAKHQLETLASATGIETASLPDTWRLHWDAASAAFPVGTAIPFLQKDSIEAAARYCLLPQDKVTPILDTAELIAKDANMAKLAWLWHFILFALPDGREEPVGAWPLPASSGEEFAALFPAVILLSGCPRLQNLHAVRGIPEDVVADTMWDVNNSMNIYERRYGTPGLGSRYFGWLMNHFNGMLYRLGRLQFGIRQFGRYVHVFRHSTDGRIVALSSPNLRFRGDGLLDGTNDRFDQEHGWTSSLSESDGVIAGHPVSREGYASEELIRLPALEWQRLLAPGDFVYDVHIPADDRLTPELYNASYARAPAFFQAFYPELTFRAYTCSSWLLDPQLKSLLPASSNIVLFQLDYHLYPIGGGDASFYNFLFDCHIRPVEQLPELSSMQKTVKRYMLEGGLMRAMGGFKCLQNDAE